MLKFAWIIICKDLRLVISRGSGLPQALLLGLLLIFIFSLAQGTGEVMPAAQAASVFWLSSAFCQILVFNQLYALEEDNSARQALLLAPFPVQGIWLGKAVTGLLLLLLAQALFLPAAIVFLGQSLQGSCLQGFLAICGADLGMCALGSLMGAAAQGQSGRESLLSIVLFPLLVPVLLAGISLGAQTFSGSSLEQGSAWLGVLFAFDAVYIATGLVLFGFLYSGDE